mgnify:FL=1
MSAAAKGKIQEMRTEHKKGEKHKLEQKLNQYYKNWFLRYDQIREMTMANKNMYGLNSNYWTNRNILMNGRKTNLEIISSARNIWYRKWILYEKTVEI